MQIIRCFSSRLDYLGRARFRAVTNNSTHEKQFNSQYEIKPETKVSFSRLMNYMMLKRKRTFSSLPIDCWLGILGYLDESCVLASISAVSRDFHTLTLPLLYKNISWEWSSVPLSRILGLFRTVIQNPKLASFIQHVTLLSDKKKVEQHNWNIVKANGNQIWKDEASKFSDVIEAAQGVIKKAEFPEEAARKWNSAIQDGNAYALVAILFSQRHNLVSLELDYTFVWQSGFPGLMLRHALFSAPNGTMSESAHLSTIDYGSNVPLSEEEEPLHEYYPEGYPSCNRSQFMAWFHLPSVVSISIWLRDFQDAIISQNNSNKYIH